MSRLQVVIARAGCCLTAWLLLHCKQPIATLADLPLLVLQAGDEGAAGHC